MPVPWIHAIGKIIAPAMRNPQLPAVKQTTTCVSQDPMIQQRMIAAQKFAMLTPLLVSCKLFMVLFSKLYYRSCGIMYVFKRTQMEFIPIKNALSNPIAIAPIKINTLKSGCVAPWSL
jgi:hypothetical protein